MAKVTLSNGNTIETDDVVRAIFSEKGANAGTRTLSPLMASERAGTERVGHRHTRTEPPNKVETDTLWIEMKRPREPITIRGESAEENANKLDDAGLRPPVERRMKPKPK